MRTEDVLEERTARFSDLAEAAQDAATRASTESLQTTYLHLATLWLELARMAQSMIAPPPGVESGQESRPLD